jgi:hypothetical protein
MPKDTHVDTEGILEGANQLVEPGNKLLNASTTTETAAGSIKTPTGKPPWGDGEIGNAFFKVYGKLHVDILTGSHDLGQGLLDTASSLKDVAGQYDATEDGNRH